MAYNEALAARIRSKLEAHGIKFTEKKMFGGLSFLVAGNMCVGVIKDEMCFRFDVDDDSQVLESPFIRPFDFTGRIMKGWGVLTPAGTEIDAEIDEWISLSLAFVCTLRPK